MGIKLNDGKDNMKVPGAGAYNPNFSSVTKNLP